MLMPTDELLKKIVSNERLHATDDFNGVLDLLTLMLFTNSIVPTRTTAYADLSKPLYTGYADVAGIVFTPTAQRADGGWFANTPLEVFQMDDADLPSVIRGWALYLPAGTKLYALEIFPNPVTLINTDQACSFVGEFCLGGDNWGQVTMIQ